jgi:cell wall-active antibiotic response 4TMS protein YvqF/B-box zinc finger protein
MNCTIHPDVPAVAYCRQCGKAVCETCRHLADGTVYCPEHAPAPAAAAASSPYTAPPPPPAPMAGTGASPGLAFLLGLIPGVGAIYNGQYVKGLIHVVVLGILIGIVSSDQTSDGLQPLFGMMIAVWIFYMAFEAYHTARRRQLGQPVDEFSSIMPRHGEPTKFPLAPIILIAAGLLFLLNNLDIIRFGQMIRYWPVALIALGVYLLYERIGGSERRDPQAPAGVREATNERH